MKNLRTSDTAVSTLTSASDELPHGEANNAHGSLMPTGVATSVGVAMATTAISNTAQAAVTIGAQTRPPSDKKDAWRFLTQATFGPVAADLLSTATLMSKGYVAWLNEQFARSPAQSTYDMTVGLNHAWVYDQDGSEIRIGAEEYTGYCFLSAVWTQFLKGNDQLRQRVAFALSEILVVSSANNDVLPGRHLSIAAYHDTLLKHAFGNFKSLIADVCRSPAMGDYLTFRGNERPIFEGNLATQIPDQNFARELMQLFTIGLINLNMDGTPALDANRKEVETYTPNDIEVLSYVFTGWNFDVIDGKYRNVSDLMGPIDRPGPLHSALDDEWIPNSTIYWEPMRKLMINYDGTQVVNSPYYVDANNNPIKENIHANISHYQQGLPHCFGKPGDSGYDSTKPLFLGKRLTITGNGYTDMVNALNILLAHQNIAPFIAKQMIQRLVTSNPSPAYVKRVATQFKSSNFSMKTLVQAILVDTEARDWATISSSTTYGKLREPVLRLTAALRALNVMGTRHKNDPTKEIFVFRDTSAVMPGWISDETTCIGQSPYKSRSVFNFFRPGYVLPNTKLLAPEFQAASAVEVTGYVRALFTSFFGLGYSQRGDGFGFLVFHDSTTAMGQQYLNAKPVPIYDGVASPENLRSGVYFTFHEELAALGPNADAAGVTALLKKIQSKFFGSNSALPASLKEQIDTVLSGISSKNKEGRYLTVKECVFLALVSPEFVVQK